MKLVLKKGRYNMAKLTKREIEFRKRDRAMLKDMRENGVWFKSPDDTPLSCIYPAPNPVQVIQTRLQPVKPAGTTPGGIRSPQ